MESEDLEEALDTLKAELGDDLFNFVILKKLQPGLDNLMHLRFLLTRWQELAPELWQEFQNDVPTSWWDWLSAHAPEKLAEWEGQWQSFFAFFVKQIEEEIEREAQND
jgi:hypothetical protein